MQVVENHQAGYVQPRRFAVLRQIGPVALLLAISVAMWWKLVLTDQYTWLDGYDLALQVLPWWQYQAGEWHAGRVPLWDPNEWGGQPLIGQAQPGVAYPLNWLLFALPLRHGWLRHPVLCWFFVLSRFMAALFTYWLCRDLGRSRRASVIGGSVFAFAGFMATNDWPQMFGGALWAPLVFLFVFRSARDQQRYRSACWAGLFLGVSWLAGHHQIPTFLTIASAFVWLWVILRAGRVDFRAVRAFALFLVFMLLVGALQTLPAWEYGQHARRWAGAPEPVAWDQPVPYYVHANYSTQATSLPGILFPGLATHTSPYLGMCIAALVVIGVVAAFSSTYVKLFTLAGIVSVVFALGPLTSVHGLLYALVPLVEKARSPSMALFMFSLSCAVLSAYGIDYLFESVATRRTALALAITGALVFICVAGFHFAGRPITDQRIASAGLFALATAGVLAGSRRGQFGTAWVAVLLGGIALSELSMEVGAGLPNRYDPNRGSYLKQMRETADIPGFLRTRPQPLRVDVNDKEVPFNFGDWFGIEHDRGYLASLTENLIPLEMHTPRMQQLMAVDYHIGKEPRFPNQTQVFESRTGLKVFDNPGALPRVRVVRKFVRLHVTGELPGFIADPANDLSTTASLLEDVPQTGTCDGVMDAVKLLRHVSDHVTIHANLGCPGMVVLADTNFPGWRATVDGKPAYMYEPYGVLRGVLVGAGDHLIEMTYRPTSVLAGAAMTFTGLIAGFALCFAGGRR